MKKKRPYRRPSPPRRAPGEGSIYEVKDAAGKITGYEGSIDLEPGLNGKRKRKRVRAKTKTEVAKLIRDAQRQVAAGMDIGSPRQTMAQFLQHWLDDVVKVKLAAKTHHDYSDAIKRYIAPYIGHLRLNQLTQRHVQELLKKLQKQPKQNRGGLLSPRTVEYAIGVLKFGLDRAIQERLIEFNPAALVEVPAGKARSMHALTEVEAIRFLEALQGHRLEVLFWLLLLCGLRRGEALALTWADFDATHKQLSINKAMQRIGTALVTGSPKTTSSVRVVPLPEVLAGMLAVLHAMRRQSGMYVSQSDLIFLNEAYKPIDPSSLHRTFKVLLKRAKLPETIRLHDLRHTCATLLLDAGENPTNVSALLGHARTSTTLNIYSHAVPETQARGVEALSKRLKKGDKNENKLV